MIPRFAGMVAEAASDGASPLCTSIDGHYVPIADAQRAGTGATALIGSDEGGENVTPTACTPEISPDGLRVAYQTRSHGIFIKDIPSGAVSQLPDGSANLRHGGPSVELSPSDGNRPAKH